MSKEKLTGAIVVGLLLVGFATAGYWLIRHGGHEECSVCRREIHAQSRAVVEVDGKREAVCCARCAVTLAQQRGKSVRLIQVADYSTERMLRPEAAFYVEGSRIVLCEKHEPMMDPTKHAMERVFDRCEPSLYAFARRADADEFARQNGGTVITAEQVLREVQNRP
jgi:hypothetical protein